MKKASNRERFCPSTTKSRAITGKPQPKITEHFRSNSNRKYSKQHPKQRQITQLLLKSIACASLPLSIVDKPSFRELIVELNENYAIPHRQTIKETHLPFTEKLIVNSITTEMKDVTSVYVTVDIWTNRQMRSFIGFTAHFVDNDFDLKSRLLCCEHFAERHTAVNIANGYEDVVMRYQIDGKVRRIISDNASSMKKAFELTLIDMKTSEAAEQKAAEMKNDKDLHLNDEGNVQDPEVDLDTLLALLPHRVPCFAHTMQLCIVHALEIIKGKLPGESDDQLSKRLVIHSTIAKVSKVARTLRSSTTASEFLRRNNVYILTKNQTRWNSSLKMLRSFAKAGKDVLNAAVGELSKSEKEKSLLRLSTAELVVITELVDVLSPFEAAMSQVEGESKVTISNVCAVVIGLKKSMEEMILKLHICQILPRILLDQVNMRLNLYLNQEDFRLATTLDPRFKAGWLQTDEEKALPKEASIHSTKELLKRKAAIEDNSCEGPSSSYNIQSSSSSDSEEKEMVNTGLFSFMPSTASRKKRKIDSGLTEESIVKNEVERYFATERQSMDSDVLTYWKTENAFPHLKAAAQELLGMTATSAPSERVFSHAGELYTAKRANLGVQTFAILMLMRMNSDLI